MLKNRNFFALLNLSAPAENSPRGASTIAGLTARRLIASTATGNMENTKAKNEFR
jgi:hypothetical protein